MLLSDARLSFKHATAPFRAASTPALLAPASSQAWARPRALSVTRSLLRGLKHIATHWPLDRQAATVASILPATLWYSAALKLARAQGRLVERMGGNRALTTELMLDLWLRELSFSGSYPIPYRCRGLEVCKTRGPKLITWTHLPFTEVPLRSYLEGGCGPLAVVSDAGKVVGDQQFQIFGVSERVEALLADTHLLPRAVRALRAGKTVAFMADPFMGGPLSDVPVRLASRLGVPLLFQWAELAADDTLQVTFREAPRPYSRDRSEIAENMEFLRVARARTLERLGWGVRT